MKVAAALFLVISVVIVSQANAQDDNKMKDMIGKFMAGGDKEEMKKKFDGMMKAFAGMSGGKGGGAQIDVSKVMENPQVKEILSKLLKSDKVQKLKEMVGKFSGSKS